MHKPTFNSEVEIPVMETFHSIQGEGAHSGRSAFFIRLAGCDVGCHWCDVKESWEVDKSQLRTISSVLEELVKEPCAFVVITGGEPCMYDLGPLTEALINFGMQTHLETSGAYPLSGEWHWICFSPKKFKAPLEEFYQKANELKTVIFNKNDIEWTQGHIDKMNSDAQIFLQPEWSKKEEMMPIIVEAIQQDPRKRISVQIHKYLNIP